MTKQDLENLDQLSGEIKDIEKQIKKLEGRARFYEVGDSVRDYRSGRGVPVAIHGIGYNKSTHEKRQILIGILCVKRKNLLEQKIQIEEEMRNIQQSDVRRIIRMKHFDKMSWNEIAARMGEKYSVDCIKKKYQRFLKKN